jgi:hypothetical protein
MQMVVDVKICSRLVSRMVNIPILGRFHRYVRGIEVTILSNSALNISRIPLRCLLNGPWCNTVEVLFEGEEF